MDEVKRAKAGANVLHGGDFEDEEAGPQEAWVPQETTLDDGDLIARRVSAVGPAPDKDAKKADKQDGKKGGKVDDKKDKKPPPGPRPDLPAVGKQCLMLQIKPKYPEAAPQALERTFLAMTSPAVRLPPGTLVRISGWMRIPAPLSATTDGPLLYDLPG